LGNYWGTEVGVALLRKLKRREAEARTFGSWGEVAAFMHAGTSDDPKKDAILRAIALSREEDEHPLWSSALLRFFWPGLLTLFKKRWRWDPNPDELWQTIVAEFLEAVKRLDVRRRRERIASKLVNDTYSRVYRAYEPQWRRQEHERAVDPEKIEPLMPGTTGIDLAAIELREVQEREIARYRAAFDAGVIGEEDFLLLVATCVYGKSVADYAREIGRSYQALKKKRQRALAAVEAWRRGE
jgi:hypothetical protein